MEVMEYEIVDSIPDRVKPFRNERWDGLRQDMLAGKVARFDNPDRKAIVKLRQSFCHCCRVNKKYPVLLTTRIVPSENGDGWSLFVWRKK